MTETQTNLKGETVELRPEQFGTTSEYFRAVYNRHLSRAMLDYKKRIMTSRTPKDKIKAKEELEEIKRQALADTYATLSGDQSISERSTLTCLPGIDHPKEEFTQEWTEQLLGEIETFLRERE